MLFLIVGVLLVLLKVADIGPVGGYSWWMVLTPFGLAAAWWLFADVSGLTRKRAMDKMDARKRERRERDMQALGLNVRQENRKIRVLKEGSGGKPKP